jgi:septal ring factor EnvC (AmiA/AmiB activator)
MPSERPARVLPNVAMTTAVTSPAGSGARASGPGRGLLRFPSRRWRVATGAAVLAVALATGCLLVVSDVQARTEIRTTEVSLATVDQRLSGVQSELARARRRLAAADSGAATVTGSFDAAQSTLATTRKSLSAAEAGIHSQGVDLGVLNSCLSGVEEALNQISVGQTSAGLATLRAAASSCAALDEAV